MKIEKISIDGKKGTIEVLDKIFSAKINSKLVSSVLYKTNANYKGRHAKTKQQNEVSGPTSKIYAQKGTGGARAGNIKSGTRVGGGRIFGPRPRNYHFKLNVKLKRLARKSAFSFQAKNKGIMVMNDLSSLSTKTKDFKALMSSLKMENDKVLFILSEKNENAYLGSRNLKKVKVVTTDSFNTYDLLNASKIIVSSESIKKIENILN